MLDLKEIIWEITTKCNNNCDYCGSAGCASDPITDSEDIRAIANKIAMYPPSAINISGGDPTLVDAKIHQEITKIFRANDIEPKIIVNPLSMRGPLIGNFVDVIALYDAIGISLNTEEELKVLNDNLLDINLYKVAFISNFNKNNLWMFDTIFTFIQSLKTNCTWQVQFTMFMDEEDPNAIYNSELATAEFFKKIEDARHIYSKILLADNVNNGVCTAGTNSLGILANGDVIPCLSMRSWCKDIPAQVQGNLLDTLPNPLKEIWENMFKEYRFSKGLCCKDHCKNVVFDDNAPASMLEEIARRRDNEPTTWPKLPTVPGSPVYPRPGDPNIVMVYGVNLNPPTFNPPEYNGPSWEDIVAENTKNNSDQKKDS